MPTHVDVRCSKMFPAATNDVTSLKSEENYHKNQTKTNQVSEWRKTVSHNKEHKSRKIHKCFEINNLQIVKGILTDVLFRILQTICRDDLTLTFFIF